MAPTGLALPDEARQWWGWHDGAEAPHNLAIELELVRSWEFLRLAKCVDKYQRLCSGFPDPPPPDGLLPWPRNWFPVCNRHNGMVLFIDCSLSTRPEAPAGVRWWHGDEELPELTAASLTQVAAAWLLGFELDIWHYDRAAGQWVYEYNRIPADLGVLAGFL